MLLAVVFVVFLSAVVAAVRDMDAKRYSGPPCHFVTDCALTQARNGDSAVRFDWFREHKTDARFAAILSIVTQCAPVVRVAARG
jgi:hypothetical protein